MKLFRVDLDNIDWDTYNACLIAAESEEQVNKMLESCRGEYSDGIKGDFFFIEGNQAVTVTEINLDEVKEPYILLSSFNAG